MVDVKAYTPGTGDEVYLEDGQVAEFCAKVPGGYVVQPIYEDDGEPHLGDTLTVRTVFSKPPVPKYDQQTSEALARLDVARADLAKVREEAAAFAKEERSRQERINRHGLLETLDKFIQAKITHVVTTSWNGFAIEDLRKVTEESHSYSRLVTLVGANSYSGEVPLKWRFGTDQREGVPCCSIDEAREVATGLMMKKIAEAKGSPHHLEAIQKDAARAGLSFPDEADAIVRAYRIAEAEKQVGTAQNELAVREARLAALRAKGGAG